MSAPSQTAELESALLARAKALSEKSLADAGRKCDELIASANERLRLREEHEAHAAREFSERTYRQRIQAGEIRMQRQLEWLRWRLVQEAMDALSAQLKLFVEDEEQYLRLIGRSLAKAAAAIERRDLVAELNARDWARVSPRWESFCHEAGVTAEVRLAQEPLSCLGGIRVRDVADTIRVDLTFEGRLTRMLEALQQMIMGRLFPVSVVSADDAP